MYVYVCVSICIEAMLTPKFMNSLLGIFQSTIYNKSSKKIMLTFPLIVVKKLEIQQTV